MKFLFLYKFDSQLIANSLLIEAQFVCFVLYFDIFVFKIKHENFKFRNDNYLLYQIFNPSITRYAMNTLCLLDTRTNCNKILMMKTNIQNEKLFN